MAIPVLTLGACGEKKNPLLVTSTAPYEAPLFPQITNEDYKPAFDKALEEARADIDRIVNNPDEPTFANTVEALAFSGERLDNVAIGDGPIDAVFKAIDKITKTGYSLDDYSIRAVTAGEDALGEATVRLKKDGKTFTGRGVSMDIIESSVHAYISAINKVVAEEGLTCERE